MMWAPDKEVLDLIARCRRKGIPINPYLKIVRAGIRGTGVRLTEEDVRSLCDEHAIYTAALVDTHDALERAESQNGDD